MSATITAIKFRERGRKAWWFLTPQATGTRLKIHASQFASADEAQRMIERWTPANPELEFKVTELWR